MPLILLKRASAKSSGRFEAERRLGKLGRCWSLGCFGPLHGARRLKLTKATQQVKTTGRREASKMLHVDLARL